MTVSAIDKDSVFKDVYSSVEGTLSEMTGKNEQG